MSDDNTLAAQFHRLVGEQTQSTGEYELQLHDDNAHCVLATAAFTSHEEADAVRARSDMQALLAPHLYLCVRQRSAQQLLNSYCTLCQYN